MHLAWALKIRYDNIDAAPCVCVLWKWRPELRFVLSVWRLGTLGAGPFLIDHLVEKAQAAGGGSNSGAKIFKGCVVKKISAVVELGATKQVRHLPPACTCARFASARPPAALRR